MLRIIILSFTSIIINFIFLLIYRLAVKEIGSRDKKISHLQGQLDGYQKRE